MFKFSTRSIQLLNTVDKRLVILTNEVLKISKVDFGITEGWRSQEKQLEYYKKGTSQCDGINKISKHQLGKAIDIICYDPKTHKPTYDKKELYYYIAGLFEAKAEELNKTIFNFKDREYEYKDCKSKEPNNKKDNRIKIQWGGWWSFPCICSANGKLRTDDKLVIASELASRRPCFEDCPHFELK